MSVSESTRADLQRFLPGSAAPVGGGSQWPELSVSSLAHGGVAAVLADAGRGLP